MYCGIGEKQLAQIDNEQNRKIVKANIIAEYNEKFIPAIADEIHKKMIQSLGIILGSMKLHQLLVLTADDCDTLIWNKLFDYLKDNVCENIFGAKRFFEVGGYAQLQDDEFWDEYHIVLDMLPEKTYEFMVLENNTSKWTDKVKEVGEYVKKVSNCKCKWVGFSNDGSYEDFSKGSFDNKKDCYDDMRQAVLEKMKWNTQFDEDFTESDDAVGYKVRFAQNEIIHSSFSGVYVYRIIGEGETLTKDEIFTADFNEWLKKMGFDYV